MKTHIQQFITCIILAIVLTSCNNISGVYSADMTIMQSGYRTQFKINYDGTATIIDTDGSTEKTYWEKNSNHSIRINDPNGAGYGYYIDFNREKIYYGASDWRSNNNGFTYTKY